jgi:hypothetical protein
MGTASIILGIFSSTNTALLLFTMLLITDSCLSPAESQQLTIHYFRLWTCPVAVNKIVQLIKPCHSSAAPPTILTVSTFLFGVLSWQSLRSSLFLPSICFTIGVCSVTVVDSRISVGTFLSCFQYRCPLLQIFIDQQQSKCFISLSNNFAIAVTSCLRNQRCFLDLSPRVCATYTFQERVKKPEERPLLS